jgi:hypothetical protein
MRPLTKSYFDKKMRVGKLDSALLFLLSLTGILFAIVRVVSPPETSILYSIPLILFGVALPFYYGYFLGAITRNTAIDRFRGWIFFLFGLSAYSYTLLEEWIPTALALSSGSLASSIGRITAGAIAVGIVAGIGSLAVLEFGSRLRNFVFEIVGDKRSILTDRASIHTVSSALFLASGAAILRDPRVVYLETGFLGLLAFLGILGLSITLGIYFLRKSEYYAKRANTQFTRVRKYGRLHGKFKLPRRFGLIASSILSIVLVAVGVVLALGYVDLAITLVVLILVLALVGLILKKRLFSSRFEITFTT